MRWLPVSGYEGIYEISDHGQIKRIKRGPGTTIGKLLKPDMGKWGHCRVTLFKNGKKSRRLVHKLVLETFEHKKPTRFHEVRHLDGNPLNNTISNLKWGTHKQNGNDMVKHGRVNRKLSDEEVSRIRRLRLQGAEFKKIAAMFNVHHTTIWLICNGRTYQQVV